MPPPSNIDSLHGPLHLGSRGPDVQNLQKLLNQNLSPSPGLNPDGIFGVKTDSALRAFQSMKGLKPDGIVGPFTCKALQVGYIPLPAPKPIPGGPLAPGGPTLPQLVLFHEIVANGLKVIVKQVDNLISANTELEGSHAGSPTHAALRQAGFLLGGVMTPGADAQVFAMQVRLAMGVMTAGVAGTVNAVAQAHQDRSEYNDLLMALIRVTPEAVDVVRKTLQGNFTLHDGRNQLRSVLQGLDLGL